MSSTADKAIFLQHCMEQDQPVQQVILERYRALHHRIQMTQEHLWTNGNSGRLSQQIGCYFGMLAGRFGGDPPTVCETGFNVGHSAVTFLSALPDSAQYFGFDLGQLRRLTWEAAALLNTSFFPGRVHLKYGDSAVTLPQFVRDHPVPFRCDVISIDGHHSTKYMMSDWRAFRQMAHEGSLVFVDDINISASKSGVNVKAKDAHSLYVMHPELEIVGCAKLRGTADPQLDEGSEHQRQRRPESDRILNVSMRRGWEQWSRPGGYYDGTLRPKLVLSASPGMCVARYRPQTSRTGTLQRTEDSERDAA